MKIPKSLLVAGAVATVSLAGITGLGVASAATSTYGTSGTSIVDKLAAKFNLKKEDVQAVFDENHAAHEAEHQQEVSDRLQKLVDNGKITADQKTKIEAKMKELQSARDAEMKALDAWADQNKIDRRYVMMGDHGDSDRLQKLVDDGKITADQKKLITDKQAELKTKREAAKAELETWAKDNGIDAQYLHLEGGRGMGMRHGGPDDDHDGMGR